MRGRFANIRQNGKVLSASREYILNRLTRIVRNRKGLNFEIPNTKRLMAIDDTKIETVTIYYPAGHPRSVSHPDRQGMLSRQTKNAADVITMFVRHQYSGKIGRQLAQAQHTGSGLPQPEATIEHYARCPRLDKQRVTSAAAAERGKTDHCNC